MIMDSAGACKLMATASWLFNGTLDQELVEMAQLTSIIALICEGSWLCPVGYMVIQPCIALDFPCLLIYGSCMSIMSSS